MTLREARREPPRTALVVAVWLRNDGMRVAVVSTTCPLFREPGMPVAAMVSGVVVQGMPHGVAGDRHSREWAARDKATNEET